MINKHAVLRNITLRGYFVSKQFLKKNKRQSLIYLRSPKHFNIGKQKVFSFNNKFFFSYNFNKSIFYPYILNNKSFNYFYYLKNYATNLNFKVSSFKISTTTTIL